MLTGPNNAGKSELLHDVLRLAANLEPGGAPRERGEEPQTRVLSDLAFVSRLTVERLLRGLISVADRYGEQRWVQGIGPDLKTSCRRSLPAELKSILYRPVLTARSVRTTALGELMPLRVAFLGCKDRQELLAPTTTCSPARAPENLLQALRYADRSVHEDLDAAFSAAFPGLHVQLDATEQLHLYLRLASQFPQPSCDPIEAVRQFEGLPRADEQGDGCRNYLAIVLTFLLGQGRIVLLDQPELFLYPQQARQLGCWISDNAPRLGCQVFLATHSVQLLRGLLDGSADVTILRLTRTGNATAIRVVPAEIAAALARLPQLASQQALDCLFREGAVVAPEADDSLVYETAAARLLDIGSVRFLHAHGGKQLGPLARILRQASIPTCVVAGLDVLRTEAEFSELVQAVTGEPLPASFLATRERLAKYVEGLYDERALSASAHEVERFLEQFKRGTLPDAVRPRSAPPRDPAQQWSRLQRDQLADLPTELRVWVEELLEELKRKGIFLSPKGHSRVWFPAADQESWFAKAMQALQRGDCPPDLRAFVADILAHLRACAMPARAARARPGT